MIPLVSPESKKLLLLPMVNFVLLHSLGQTFLGISMFHLGLLYLAALSLSKIFGDEIEIDEDMSLQDEKIFDEASKLFRLTLPSIGFIIGTAVVIILFPFSFITLLQSLNSLNFQPSYLTALGVLSLEFYLMTELLWEWILAMKTGYEKGYTESRKTVFGESNEDESYGRRV